MMVYQLRRGLSFCNTGARLIFLDVDADRYFCLAEHVEASLRRLIAGRYCEPTDAIQGLLERRILVADGKGVTLMPCAPPASPEHSLLGWARAGASLGSGLAAMGALISSLARLRARSLTANLQAVPATPIKVGSDVIDRLVRISSAFDRATRWMSSQDRCLGQSLAVARMARREGIQVDIVIGVSLGPFVAHCWVQHGAYVVNDHVETVARYTPILVA